MNKDYDADTMRYFTSSPVHPTQWFDWDFKSKASKLIGSPAVAEPTYNPPVQQGISQLDGIGSARGEQLVASSADGTQVPMTLFRSW